MPRGFGGGPLAVRVDTADLSRAVTDLKRIDKQLANDLRKAVRQAAEPMKQRVKANAGFSRRIPAAVRVRARYPRSGAVVTIDVDPKKAPHGAPINNKGKGGTFRHRVYGRDVWVDQRAVPFFDDATETEERQAEAAIDRAMTDLLRKAGFRT